jgi:hypothetical protein
MADLVAYLTAARSAHEGDAFGRGVRGALLLGTADVADQGASRLGYCDRERLLGIEAQQVGLAEMVAVTHPLCKVARTQTTWSSRRCWSYADNEDVQEGWRQ